MLLALRRHWPEYAIEALLIGTFMLSASLFGALLEHPASPVRALLPEPFVRRVLMGIAMGTTAVGMVYSRCGKRSGAHFNPAVTLTFYRLGRVRPEDAVFYVGAQFAGAVCGVGLANAFLHRFLADPAVNWVATVPGRTGIVVASVAEFAISFLLMLVLLNVTSRERIANLGGLCAGLMVALYISFEAPYSGMSMNPARTFGSALFAREWIAWWVYIVSPPFGMLAAAEVYRRSRGVPPVRCAKLHHQNAERCIFCGANS